MIQFSDTFQKFSQHYSSLFEKDNLDLFFQKVLVERNSQLSGYYDLPFKENQEIFDYLKHNADFLDSVNNIIIVGIGGSSLGTKAIDTLLSHQSHRKKIKLRFLEHTDPIMIQKDLRRVKYEDTLFIVISKSGLTIETTSLFKYILARFSLLKEGRKQHLVAITDMDSPLHKWCQQEKISSITIAQNIGGRFSVLSAVGLLPLAILGYDIQKILQGARQISDAFFIERRDNVLKKALFLAKNETIYPMNVLFSYSSVFRHFNAWYVQLWGESLGKFDTYQQKRGLTPIALIGSIDQHSFLQLIMQGPSNKTVTFLSVENLSQRPLYIPDISLEGLEATDFVNQTSFNHLLKLQCVSTKESIISQNVPVDSIVLDELNEQSVGALVFYYELLTSCVGILLQIDTYNQPGVEFGKKILREKFTHS